MIEVACHRCGVGGTASEGTSTPLGWSADLAVRPPRLLCPTCTREHARSIEAKLDEQYWA